jgi:hypothetical protein
MKNLPLTYLEIELLIDALSIQAKDGHLNAYLQENADSILVALNKLRKD